MDGPFGVSSRRDADSCVRLGLGAFKVRLAVPTALDGHPLPYALQPPSMMCTAPVVKADSSLAR